VKTISKLKKELDKWFSLYIRLRYATPQGMVKCFTCDKTSHYKKGIHAGHFMSRKHLSTRWHEDNVQVQCYRCNIHLTGNIYAYSKLLDIRIGEGTSDNLEELSKVTTKIMRHEYEELITKYKQKVKHEETRLS
jgi:hypothetical protein|tara:strand:- start:822 stop:1223 length:402 start_codon:yes stop_codon:yes gene_type:complete